MSAIIQTVSSLVAHQVLEQLKLHHENFFVVEFERDEVFLTDMKGSSIRVSRLSPDQGEIVVLQGSQGLRDLVAKDEIQSFSEFFKMRVA